jgi:hypothetical protein
MTVMMPRGLAAAILAINFGPEIVNKLGLSIDGFFKDAVFVIILGTAIICTVGVAIISHSENKKIQLAKPDESSKEKSRDKIL